MSKFWENVGGFVAFLYIMAHTGAGFMVMIATVFMGLSEATGGEIHPLIGFPIFLLGLFFWVSGGLSTISWTLSGTWSGWFGGKPPAEFRLTFVGFLRRAVISVLLWLAILGVLSLVPPTRAVLIRPLGLAGGRAVPLLSTLIHDPSRHVRRSAIETLNWIGPPARGSASEIARHLDDSDEQVRLSAHAALSKLNPELLPK